MINIKTDSRKIKPGDTFVALRGIDGDGHNYIETAIKNGATKIIAEEGAYSVETIIVPDSREYLLELLSNQYKEYLDEMTFIGITGTNGKTTTAYLIYQACNLLDRKCAYIGTIGFYMDCKICNLANTSPDICDLYDMIMDCYESGYKTIVLEASSQGLAYNRLATLTFDYAIFTNLTPEHLDYHKSMHNYALAKQKLFKQLKKDGVSIVNIDDPYYSYYINNNTITYGFNSGDYRVTDYQLNLNGIDFVINYKYHVKLNILGKYNIYNALVTFIVLQKLAFSDDKIIRAIGKLKPPDGRMDIISYRSNSIIIDYAHTPDAMENVIDTIKEIQHRHLYIIFGCTGNRDRLKRPIMMNIALNNADYVIVTSDDLHYEPFGHIVNDMQKGITKTNYEIIQDRKLAIEKGISLLKEQDIILILGKGHEEALIIGNKKIPFKDHKVVLDILNYNYTMEM